MLLVLRCNFSAAQFIRVNRMLTRCFLNKCTCYPESIRGRGCCFCDISHRFVCQNSFQNQRNVKFSIPQTGIVVCQCGIMIALQTLMLFHIDTARTPRNVRRSRDWNQQYQIRRKLEPDTSSKHFCLFGLKEVFCDCLFRCLDIFRYLMIYEFYA